MIRQTWRAGRAVGFALLLGSCARPVGGLADGGARAAAKLGIKVSLPDGWAAQVAPDGSFHAGPPGRPLLSIERAPGAAGAFPTPEALRAAFISGLKKLTVRDVGISRSENFSAIQVDLAKPARADSAAPPDVVALVGVKRVGDDLFLCATDPGASQAEVELASRVCGGLGSSPR